ncbi:hypothetical protein BGX33_010154 [Mortierella sp. NVP41]|nr:hypothetical protein BGX33_010154 [Mortierella sp. NVP41]
MATHFGLPTHAQDADTLFVSEFKDGAIRDPKVSTERFAKVPDARNGIQVISATTEHEADPWGLYFNTVRDRSIAGEVRLRWISSGRVDQTDRPMSVSAAFGDEDRPPDLPSSDTKPLAGSTIGLLVGGIALVAGMSFFICIRFVRPRYRARRKEKKKSGPRSGSSFSTVAEDRDWKDGEVGFGEDSNNNYIGDKFEATSEYSFDLNGRDKILVTPDIDGVEGGVPLDLEATKSAPMKDLELHTHPRPHVVTTLQENGNTTQGVDHNMIAGSGKDFIPTSSVTPGSPGGFIVRVWPAESHVDQAAVRNQTEKEEVEERASSRSSPASSGPSTIATNTDVCTKGATWESHAGHDGDDDEEEVAPAYSQAQSDTIDIPTPRQNDE